MQSILSNQDPKITLLEKTLLNSALPIVRNWVTIVRNWVNSIDHTVSGKEPCGRQFETPYGVAQIRTVESAELSKGAWTKEFDF